MPDSYLERLVIKQYHEWIRLQCYNCGTEWDARVKEEQEGRTRTAVSFTREEDQECPMCGPSDIDHSVDIAADHPKVYETDPIVITS